MTKSKKTLETNTEKENIEQQFALQRIYVKDLSFEAPQSPAIFRKEWKPSIELNLKTRHVALEDNLYEVTLMLSLTAKNADESIAFIVEIQQAGIFLVQGVDTVSLNHALGSLSPSILFPYARETLDSLIVRGSFPALMLAPVNFDALYQQEMERIQAEKAAKEDKAAVSTH
ncbi:UNVERIFIED_CONTAM: hypothetical protein GTU68_052155 [Idotea baltica]|nr:hypothetical protein [Idotea baltica]